MQHGKAQAKDGKKSIHYVKECQKIMFSCQIAMWMFNCFFISLQSKKSDDYEKYP